MFDGQLLETIKVQDGRLLNAEYHWARVTHAHRVSYGCAPKFCWNDIQELFSDWLEGVYKLRVIYSRQIDFFELLAYEMSIPKKWKLLEVNDLKYHLKYADRSAINHLRKQYKNDADDLIFIQNGEITDASYANLVFFDGTNWVTPMNPLLAGTQRAKLLDQGLITPQIIREEDLWSFSHFKLINALLEFDFPKMPMDLIFV